MNMKKLSVLLLLCVSLNGMSQIKKTTHDITRLDGRYKIRYNERYFDVDTTTVTVKLKDLKASFNMEYKVLRQNRLGFVDIQKPENISLEKFVESLSQNEMVESVIYSSFGEYGDFIPNDTDLNSQWHLPVINAYKAWDITTGSANIIVAILDSGTDWMHPDLGLGSDIYQNIYLNQGEDIWSNPNNPTTGNGIDDDNNGYIDDWKGWNFATNSNDARTTVDHGTFVAGIVGAKTQNSHGVAGVAGGKNGGGVKLLPYCVGVSAPVTSLIDDAIVAAVDNGAKIIQFSLTISYSNDIEAAIQYAINNNVVIICASGNNYSSSVSYPSSNVNIISVGATDSNNNRASFSNYGNNLDVVAPGVDIYSTTLNNTYKISSGTSFAAPIVSGIAALIWSVNPNLTGQQVRNIIESTCNKNIPNFTVTQTRPNGTWNNQLGYGLVDAYAAVQAACATMPSTINFNGSATITPITVTSNTTIVSCGNINVQYVTVTNNAILTLKAVGNINIQDVNVQNNSKLILDAGGKVNIIRNFKVDLGSMWKTIQ